MELQGRSEFKEYLPSISALIALNVFLSALKLWVGYTGDSSAMRSVGWNNLADFLYSALLAIGLWISTQPADSSHPEGHDRFESLLGLFVSLVILGTGAFVLWDAYHAFTLKREMDVGLPG
ncbi:MAG: cation diffusion facilitator family transporter, partial [bacterium]